MSPQDPYVERLLEGFAFLTARIRLRMDAQYPEFTQNLLGLLYPNLVAPTPSCGVFEFQPDFKEGALIDGFTIPRGTSMITRPESTDTACEFLTTSDIILRPLVVDEAEYTDQPSLIQKWLPDTPSPILWIQIIHPTHLTLSQFGMMVFRMKSIYCHTPRKHFLVIGCCKKPLFSWKSFGLYLS